jgi:hypothetical protein
MFRNVRRKCWKSYLKFARLGRGLRTWRHVERRAWFGHLSTNRLLLLLGLFAATLYTAHVVYIADYKCRSRAAVRTAEYSIKGNVQQTGSVGLTAPTLTNDRSAKVGHESSEAAQLTQEGEVSRREGRPFLRFGGLRSRSRHVARRMDLREVPDPEGGAPSSSRNPA